MPVCKYRCVSVLLSVCLCMSFSVLLTHSISVSSENKLLDTHVIC